MVKIHKVIQLKHTHNQGASFWNLLTSSCVSIFNELLDHVLYCSYLQLKQVKINSGQILNITSSFFIITLIQI